MQQHQVEVVGADFLEETVHRRLGSGALRFRQAAGVKPNFGDDRVFVAGYCLQGRQEIRMGAVEVSQVENADAPVVTTLEQSLQLLLPHPRMIGLAVAPAHPGAEAKTAQLERSEERRVGKECR